MLEYKLYALNVIDMYKTNLPPSQRSVTFYDVYCNGKKHRFADYSDAYNFASRIEANIFRCEESLEWCPNPEVDYDTYRIECYSRNVHPVRYSTGDVDVIFKAVSDALTDNNVKRIIIFK